MKPLDQYSPHKLGRYGKRSICKPCSAIATGISRRKPAGREATKRNNAKWRSSPRGAAAKCEAQRRRIRKNPAKHLWHRARLRAKAKGIPFTITVDDVVIPEVCPVLGVKLTIANSQFRAKRFGGDTDSMSLDRIIPELGYVPGNVAVISWRANDVKNDATLEELEAVVKWLRAQRDRVQASAGTTPALQGSPDAQASEP